MAFANVGLAARSALLAVPNTTWLFPYIVVRFVGVLVITSVLFGVYIARLLIVVHSHINPRILRLMVVGNPPFSWALESECRILLFMFFVLFFFSEPLIICKGSRLYPWVASLGLGDSLQSPYRAMGSPYWGTLAGGGVRPPPIDKWVAVVNGFSSVVIIGARRGLVIVLVSSPA